MKAAIAYLDGRPWLQYSYDNLKKLIDDIENNYRDLLENKEIEIRNEYQETIVSLLPRKATHYPRNMYATEEKQTSSTNSIYVDQFLYSLERK